MDGARRTLLALYSLLFIAALSGLLVLAWADRSFDGSAGDWRATGEIATSGNARIAFTAVCGAFIAFGLVTLGIALAAKRSRRRETMHLSQTDGSRVRITPEALEQLVRERLEMLPEVAAADPHVHMRKHSVATDLDVAIVPGTNIAHATGEIATTTMQAYRELVGVTAVDRPEISVRYAESSELRAANADVRSRRRPLVAEPLTWEEAEARDEAEVRDGGIGDREPRDRPARATRT